ncbi:MAG: HNH endonuclease signature motif containing protein, partial [Propionibacteriaceae bacterium]
RTGAGRSTDGQNLSPDTVARLLHDAEILPTVIDRYGRVRWQETQQRCATPGQTLFLIARDGGCSFPGCDEPPAHCDRHHIVPWADGGRTRVDNLTLLCGYHHREFGRRGWNCRMINDLPHWIPPRWVDQDQQPRLHPRFQIRRTTQPRDVPRRT